MLVTCPADLAVRGRTVRSAADHRPVVALVIDAVFPFHLGGRETRYHELTKRLADRASIDVYTMRWWQGDRTFSDGSITYHAISRLHPLYSDGKRSIKQALFFALACTKLLGKRFDVIDADQMPYFQIIVLRIIATVRRKRLVVTWHEVWGKEYWREYVGRFGALAWLVELTAMRLPDHIVAASDQTADRLRSVLGDNAAITVAPNGIDLHAIGETYPDTSVTDVVVVGRLIAHKRVAVLLEALAMLHAEGVLVTCRVIGDGPDRDALHGQAALLGLASFVDFRHDVREQKELYALVKAARVAVFPSEREGFGAAVLEALACRVPVVTTSSPDNLSQYLVAQSARGRVCEPTPAAIARAVRSVLADRTRQVPLDSWLDDYSWDNIAGRVSGALRISARAQVRPSGAESAAPGSVEVDRSGEHATGAA
jgi:glycosyltransferase involved in cell wall biosynthesis